MKSAIIFSVLAIYLVGVYSASLMAKRKCARNTGVDIKLLQNLDDTLAYVKDEKLDCFFACTMKADGIMDSDGNINEEHRIYSQDPNAKHCAKLRGSSACETCGKVAKCMITLAAEEEKEKKKE